MSANHPTISLIDPSLLLIDKNQSSAEFSCRLTLLPQPSSTGNNNTLDGGAGNDALVAAAGHTGDHVVFQFGFGHDAVQGFSTAGNDVVHLESFGLGTFANLQST